MLDLEFYMMFKQGMLGCVTDTPPRCDSLGFINFPQSICIKNRLGNMPPPPTPPKKKAKNGIRNVPNFRVSSRKHMLLEPIRKRAHTQLVGEHSATVVSARSSPPPPSPPPLQVMTKFNPSTFYFLLKHFDHIHLFT